MQTYMPALLAYFTQREWTHLYAAASSQLLRMDIIFRKLISLGCWAPGEVDLKMLSAMLLLLEYGQDACRLSLERRVATQESVKYELPVFQRLSVEREVPEINNVPQYVLLQQQP